MRRIICKPCAEKLPPKLHPLDAEDGFQMRTLELLVKKPADHCVTINGVPQAQLASIICDDCGQPIPDGAPAMAVSMWRGPVIVAWEHEYGEIMS